MTESNIVESVPKKVTPTDTVDIVMSVGDWLKTYLLLLVPFFNIYLLIKWAIGGEGINRNKTNYIRATLILYSIVMAYSVVLILTLGALICAVYFLA